MKTDGIMETTQSDRAPTLACHGVRPQLIQKPTQKSHSIYRFHQRTRSIFSPSALPSCIRPKVLYSIKFELEHHKGDG